MYLNWRNAIVGQKMPMQCREIYGEGVAVLQHASSGLGCEMERLRTTLSDILETLC